MSGRVPRPARSKFDEGFPPPGFEGFRPAALQFFRDLAGHQDKAWMAEHKAVYEREVKAPLISLVAALSDRFVEEGLPLRGDPARSIFRLNRDVRFSKDKAPYNTHASFALTRDGDKHAPGVLYVHLAPVGSFAAAGFFRPDVEVLHRLRLRLVEKPGAWGGVQDKLRGAGLDLDETDRLVRLPRGFDAPPDSVGKAIKLKTWIVRRDLPDDALASAALVDLLTEFALSGAPLLDFGWAAVDAR